MVMKDIEFYVDGSDGRKIDMVYMVGSKQLLIWLDKIQQPKPTVLDVDYMNMAKAKEDFCEIFNGHGNDASVKNAWDEFSNRINPCVYEYYKNHKIQKGKRDGNNPNDGGTNAAADDNDGLTDEYADALDDASRRPHLEDLEQQLAEIPNRDYLGHVINTVKKEVKMDDVLVRQILYTGLSAYTYKPINLAIMGPTSEGKTYTTEKVIQYFPKEDVWKGFMSTMALVRQNGILINSKGQPIQKQIDELNEKIRNITVATMRLEFEDPHKPKPKEEPGMSFEDRIKREVEKRKAECKNELDRIKDDAVRLIDLQGKILVFFEQPEHELLEKIKAILSHDAEEISFDYAYGGQNDITTKKVKVRGWPAVIFCSAKDPSHWEIWPEIQSRFLITSPNMSEDKVHEGNVLLAQRAGLPNTVQEEVIVSDKDQTLAKKAVSYLKRWIHNLFESNGMDYEHRNAVWIPYYRILGDALRTDRGGTDNRTSGRMLSLLNVIPLVKVHHRSNLVFGNERLVIAELQDLTETLHITQNLSGTPTYKVKFFKECFLPLFQSKEAPDENKDGSKVENRIGVTTAQLCEYYKQKTGKVINTDNMKKQFLNALLNNGFIDEQDSIINGKQKIFFPIIVMPEDESISFSSNFPKFDKDLQHARMIPSKYFKKIPKNWLELEILTLKSYRVEQTSAGPIFQIINKDDDEISEAEFIKNYEADTQLTGYYILPEYHSYCNKCFGFMLNLDKLNEFNMEVSRMDSNSTTKI